LPRVVRARAPLRLSFAGGGTDVPPYPEQHGGSVISATINRYVWCTISESDEDIVIVQSVDLDRVAIFELTSTPAFDGNLDLIKAVFRRLDAQNLPGMKIVVRSDAPPGSGLGSSSALVVALIRALSTFLNLDLTPQEVAKVSHVVERQDVGVIGGLQDHYAAAYGGFNFMEFGRGVEVMPVRLSEGMRHELESHMLLCYTGRTRLSAGILERQVGNVQHADPETLASLARLRELAVEIRQALHEENLQAFAELLDEGWQSKKGLAAGVSDSALEEVHVVAKAAGALGGKLLGAGGGGYFLFLVDPAVKEDVADALEPLGVRIEPHVEFSNEGAVAWDVPHVRADVHPAFALAR
jgi:D-glycero-alpha-D-manno-heptose-7-phosphate kinase